MQPTLNTENKETQVNKDVIESQDFSQKYTKLCQQSKAPKMSKSESNNEDEGVPEEADIDLGCLLRFKQPKNSKLLTNKGRVKKKDFPHFSINPAAYNLQQRENNQVTKNKAISINLQMDRLGEKCLNENPPQMDEEEQEMIGYYEELQRKEERRQEEERKREEKKRRKVEESKKREVKLMKHSSEEPEEFKGYCDLQQAQGTRTRGKSTRVKLEELNFEEAEKELRKFAPLEKISEKSEHDEQTKKNIDCKNKDPNIPKPPTFEKQGSTPAVSVPLKGEKQARKYQHRKTYAKSVSETFNFRSLKNFDSKEILRSINPTKPKVLKGSLFKNGI